jgi:hypothetical protein
MYSARCKAHSKYAGDKLVLNDGEDPLRGERQETGAVATVLSTGHIHATPILFPLIIYHYSTYIQFSRNINEPPKSLGWNNPITEKCHWN